MHWTIGKVKITKIVELETIGGTRFILPQVGPEDVRKLPWLIPHFANEEGRLKMSIHSLVVETPSKRIVVDTCLGNDKQGRAVPTWNNLQKPFLEDMTRAGYPPDSIDMVLCTHLHVDHVGWNTKLVEGKWVPTFAKAQYVFGKTEYEHWRAHSGEEPERAAVFEDSVKPIMDAGRAELVASDAQLTEGNHPDSDPRPQPGAYEPPHPLRRRGRAPDRGCRASSDPDGASGMVLDRRFRSGAIRRCTARAVCTLRRYADAGDRGAFRRRPAQTGRRCLPPRRVSGTSHRGLRVEFRRALFHETVN